jgi:hypothetical protein
MHFLALKCFETHARASRIKKNPGVIPRTPVTRGGEGRRGEEGRDGEGEGQEMGEERAGGVRGFVPPSQDLWIRPWGGDGREG